MKIIVRSAFIIGVAFMAGMCTPSQEKDKDKDKKNATIKGNFKDFDIEHNVHEVEVAAGKTLTHPTGSKVHIPANAFVDRAGKPIAGKVQIRYREFHTPIDIITAGITMEYDSAGRKRPFETAGMFEIRGEQNGEPVFIAKDKAVKIDLASYKEGAFNFYYLNEVKNPRPTAAMSVPFISQAVAQGLAPGENHWELLEKSGLPTENKERKEKLAAIDKKLPVQPAEPLPYDEKTPVFDLDISTKDFPELRTFEGIIWQYAGDLEDGTKNPNKNEWIFEHQWSNIRLEENGEMQYRLVLESGTKRFESEVRPALKGIALDKARALFAEKKKQYEADLKARAEEIESLRTEKNFYTRMAKFTRSFAIQQFGIYNCDRIYNDPEAIEVMANLNVPGDHRATKSGLAQVYMLVDDMVVNYSANQGTVSSFRFNPKKLNRMVVLFSGSEMAATYSRDDFKALAQKAGKEVQLDLTTVKEPIKSTTALQNIIEKL